MFWKNEKGANLLIPHLPLGTWGGLGHEVMWWQKKGDFFFSFFGRQCSYNNKARVETFFLLLKSLVDWRIKVVLTCPKRPGLSCIFWLFPTIQWSLRWQNPKMSAGADQCDNWRSWSQGDSSFGEGRWSSWLHQHQRVKFNSTAHICKIHVKHKQIIDASKSMQNWFVKTSGTYFDHLLGVDKAQFKVSL